MRHNAGHSNGGTSSQIVFVRFLEELKTLKKLSKLTDLYKDTFVSLLYLTKSFKKRIH